MNKNKGIIGIGLIIAIVLGIVVVGGGAYYLGKSGSKQAINNPENNLPNNQNQNLPVVENPKTPQVATGCNSNSVPSIKILSPNGGEVYNSGNRITVKWSSCNISKSTPIKILLQGNFSGETWNTSTVSDFNLGLTGYPKDKLLNSGLATPLTIPVSGATQWAGYSPDMKYGTYYKVFISTDLLDSTNISDISDNLLTINPLGVSTTNWKTYTNAEYGFSFQYPDTWSKNGEQLNTINRNGEVMAISVNLNDITTQSAFDLSYGLPPYGPEVYKIEEDQYNSYKNSNEFNFKKNIVAGNTAIESFTTMSKDIKGNIYDPALKLIHIVFLDKQKTGSFNLNFRTPEPGSDKEIAKFNQLLSTFKFTN